MQNVPLDAAHLFDLNAAILGLLLAAVKPEKAASVAHLLNIIYIIYVLFWHATATTS